MPVARYIRSASEFQTVIRLGETETKFVDFKADLPWRFPAQTPKRDARVKEAQKELCRDIAQFANTEGGCLAIGVAEDTSPSTGLKVAHHYVSVRDADGMRAWIEQAIGNYLIPKTLTHSVDPILLPTGEIVLVVNVPPSRHIVSLWDRAECTVEYVYRTSHGKAWMNPSEAESRMSSGSRFGRIVLEKATEDFKAAIAAEKGPNYSIATQVDLVSGVFERHAGGVVVRFPNVAVTVSTSNDERSEVFCLSLSVSSAQKMVWIPYSSVRDAWIGKSRTGDTVVGLILSVRLFVTGNGDVVIEA